MATRRERSEQARRERLRQEAEAAAEDRRRRLVRLGAGALFVAVVVVGALIAISQSGSASGSDSSVGSVAAVDDQLKGLAQHGAELGDPKAPVTIVEFGDLQCPVCKAFSEQVIPKLITGEVRGGDAKLEFKNFNIIGPQSDDAAKAALAAAAQGRYWSFIELFYANQGPENSGYVTDSFLEAIAKGAGVPKIAKWNSDRRDPRLDQELSKVDDEAAKLGFNATPSFLVEGPGGKKALVAPSLEQLKAAVQAAG